MKRYTSPEGYMDEDNDGEYIRFEDFEKLVKAVEKYLKGGVLPDIINELQSIHDELEKHED